jgi:acetoin utilization deacetylase AcuC-like enzyme
MAAPVLFRHRSSHRHDTGAHPENAARIAAIDHALSERDWLGYAVRESPAATRAALAAVHSPAHIERIEEVSRAGGGMLDADTVCSAGSLEAALHGAGGAVALVEALLDGEAPAGASLHRPPGHHALAGRAMGFCLFNSVAVAARHALDVRGAERVLILDWDVHHGNGTNDIFHADPQVLFCSVHESPLYPGTGPESDVGSGAGEGFTVNLPVPSGSGDETFCALVEHVAVPLARAFRPDLVLLSAGFDAHVDDPLADCRCTPAGFGAMAGAMRDAGAQVGAPVGLVLEGGYDLRGLTTSLIAALEVLAGASAPAVDADPGHRLVGRAHERLARWWPGL